MSESTNKSKTIETQDAEKVNEAILCVMKKDLETANHLLSEVIVNTPTDYVNEFTKDDIRFIKFWDQQQFIHYVDWHKGELEWKQIFWILNAYPRAYYYQGFLVMESGEWKKAIDFFKKGHVLEPTNPKFNIEMAHACAQLGDHHEAVKLFRQAQIVNAYSSKSDKAAALRGEGFVRIEMGDLDGAGYAYREALKIGEAKKLIRKQLKYIEYLRSGGRPVRGTTYDPSQFRQWWQFWKR